MVHSEIIAGASERFLEINRTISARGGSPKIKIDVGLSLDAPHSIAWLREDKDLLVLGFEPVSSSCESVRRTFQNQEDGVELLERFCLVPAALSDHTGLSRFFECDNPGVSSLARPKKFRIASETVVPTFRLDEFLESLEQRSEIHIERIDHIKTDCQGSDWRVVKGLTGLLGKTVAVTCEADALDYHRSKKNSIRSIRRQLEGRDFRHVNRRGRLKEILGPLIQRTIFHDYLIRARGRISGSHEEVFEEKISKNPDIFPVKDPTFVNSKYFALVQSGEVKLSQFA